MNITKEKFFAGIKLSVFFQKFRQLMEENKKIHLYLNSDEDKIKNTQTALKQDIKYFDLSDLYKNYKDLNDYLIG